MSGTTGLSLQQVVLNTPPLSPASPSFPVPAAKADYPVGDLLTPPVSPIPPRSSASLSDTSTRIKALDGDRDAVDNQKSITSLTTGGVIQNCGHRIYSCPFDIEVTGDGTIRTQLLGQGAWSKVIKTTIRSQILQANGLTTSPSFSVVPVPTLVAAKLPIRRDAETIIRNEARILTHLHNLQGHGEFIVPFYGFVESSCSIVMAALPMSLEEHIRQCSITAQQNLSTSNMSLPVIGSTKMWLGLAYRLVSALSWLHYEARVVHGDIKPGNFMLRPSSTVSSDVSLDTVFIDFSSSRLLDDTDISCNTLSAVTREYTAPELLSSKVLQDPTSVATTASDVFSLAITLITAATGDTRVYPGSVFQRQAMASQGWQVLNFVRCGEQGARLPRHGVVERAVERAVLKADMGRITAANWMILIEDMMRDGPSKSL